MKVHERIRALREQRHLTLAELSSKIGMSEAGLSLIELGKRRVTADKLQLLAEALGVKPAVFFEPDLDATLTPAAEEPAHG